MPEVSVEKNYVSTTEIETELQTLNPAPSVDIEPLTVSFEKLTDRAFELMTYLLYKEGGSLAAKLKYDSVQLLPVGADRGRDIVLLAKQQPIAVVQCKKHTGIVSRPEALREISRLILAAMVDPSILPPHPVLTYVLVASGGISEPTQILFRETKRIVKEEDALVRKCAIETRQEYKSLHVLDEVAAADRVVSVLSTASLDYLTSEDLAVWLKDLPSIYSKFFSVRTVVNTGFVEEKLAALTLEVRRSFPAGKPAGVDSWYHPASTTLFSAVSRMPGANGGPPIVLDDVYVPRRLETKIDEWLSKAKVGSEGVLVVIIAPGGYGKTSLLWNCHRARNSGSRGQTLLFSASLVATMVDRGDFGESLVALVEHVGTLTNKGVAVTICLDTFDVLAHRADLQLSGLRLISELLTVGASVVMASRPEEVALIPVEQLAALSVRLYLSEYDEDEFAAAVKSHCHAFYRASNLSQEQIEEHVQRLQNLVALGRPVKEVCLNPLTLRMLFELYAPNQVPEDINSFRLYSEYWSARVRGDRRMAESAALHGRDLAAPAQWIASEMLERGVPFLSADQLVEGKAAGHLLDLDVSDLLSRNLLIRSESGSLEFFHQTFFEHAAARFLDSVEQVKLNECVEKMREVANDAFRLPVYEQLLLLLAGRAGATFSIEDQVRTLLNEPHPGLMGVGLHAHMLAPQGYKAGRNFTTKAAQERSHHILKRFVQLIYNLQRQRVPEVVALINAAWDPNDWRMTELVARLFIWLAQSDWGECRKLLEKCDLVEALYNFVPNSTVDAERLVVSVLRHGVLDDAGWSFSQSLRGGRNFRHARHALEFIQVEVCRSSQSAAQEAQRQIVEKVQSAPTQHYGHLLDSPGRCLAAIWRAHPSLAPVDAIALQLNNSVETRLLLRALAVADVPTLLPLRLTLIDCAAHEAQPGRLHILMQEFIVPLMIRNGESDSVAWQRACDICHTLLLTVISSKDPRAPVVSNAIKCLYARGATAPDLWREISQVPGSVWMQADGFLHLFPIAVAEESPEGEIALQMVCAHPLTHSSHASILKGALPSFSKTPGRFNAVLRLAAATTDATLLLAYFDKAEASGEWNALAQAVIADGERLEQVARAALKASAGSMRVSAFLLLALLARQRVIAAPAHSEVFNWLQRETTAEVRASALPLLVATTDKLTFNATMLVLLNIANEDKQSAFNQVVEQLREVLTVPGAQLNEQIRELIIDFALRKGAIEPQVSIVGGLIDVCVGTGAIDAAQDAALRLLRSETARALSSTQKRNLGHHLDKPFLALYRALPYEELLHHVRELRSLDEHLGRLIVVSLCKSERPEIDEILNLVIGDEHVLPDLKRIIQDYREFLWRRSL